MTGSTQPPNLPDILAAYFAAMRRGAEAEEEMMALFAEDAVYSEPFSGAEPAVGKEAIRQRLRAGWEFPLPDLELEVLSCETSGDQATTTWECRSSALPGPQRGRDVYRFTDGVIRSLDVSFLADDEGES